MDFLIFSSFLPSGLLSHFDIVDFKEFYERTLTQDLPRRGKSVCLVITESSPIYCNVIKRKKLAVLKIGNN